MGIINSDRGQGKTKEQFKNHQNSKINRMSKKYRNQKLFKKL
jgi:hypothetical protein